jgi:hypothetical protein
MKKQNLFRLFSSVATATFLISGLFGQVANSDYVQYDADQQNPTNIDYVTLRTGGSTVMGYYALPDPVYHPNYNALGSWALTPDFAWDWTVTPAMATAKPGDANYVEITYTAVGTYDVTVAEHAPAAMGGCSDATPTEMVVNVIAPPTGTASINPGVTWTAITPNQSYQICSPQAAQTVTVAFVEAVPNNLASYAFQITETIELLNGAGTVVATPQVETVIQDFPTGSKLKTGNVGTLTAAAFNAATPNFTYTFSSDDLDILQNAGVDTRTRYTYKVTRTGAAAQNGFYSNISQKSGYIAGVLEYYNFTNQTVSFIVNPAPATGPIYYIPNNFNY